MKKTRGVDFYSSGIRFLPGFFSALPEGLAILLGRGLGRLVFYFSARRRVAYADLKAAFGAKYPASDRWKIVQEHYANMGQTAIEFLRFSKLDQAAVDRIIVWKGLERVAKAAAEGRGIILLTAHFGNWELMQVAWGFYRKPIRVLAREQKSGRLNQLLNRVREQHGSVESHRGMKMRDFIRSLRRGEVVGLLGDQDAGRDGGMILPFFGRKTTFPTGAFDLAVRTGSLIAPCFIRHLPGARHEYSFEEMMDCREAGRGRAEIEPMLRKFVAFLESWIERYPSEWLWGSKRWKYCWTKRLVILSDGKPGHVKQSQAVAERFGSIDTQHGRPGMEYAVETIEVRFRSEKRKGFFPWAAFFLMPWAQGRLGWLRFFFDEQTRKQIEDCTADFVISAGASLVPLNLLLGRECRAKSVVLMKPSFPFNLFRFDLAVVGAHDRGLVPRESFRTFLAPSSMDEDALGDARAEVAKELRGSENVKIAVFLGGPTRQYPMNLTDMERLIHVLEKMAPVQGPYMITTSRRTPPSVSNFLKQRVAHDSACRLLVIAAEDRRPEMAGGMMEIAEILIVTEDSISMISEAVRSGKKVVVLELHSEGLPRKHRRFKEILARESAVVTAGLADLEEKISLAASEPALRMVEGEDAALAGRLASLL